MSTRTILQARSIALGYAGKHGQVSHILHDLSLDIAAGETVVLLGPSGAGKSSLLRVLAGLQTAHAGSVRLFGETLSAPHPQTAFVFQNPTLLPWLTVRENAAFGLHFKHQPDLTKPLAASRVECALAEVGLSHAAQQLPTQLSGGMAQRVALARAMVRAPQLLFLDEPFGALDALTRSEMQALLRRLIEQHHTAAILVTHDIDEALLLADRIVLIGQSPARIIGQWHLTRPFPRQAVLASMNTLRTDILAALDDARNHHEQSQSVEFVI